MALHKDLTGAELHEPKGVATATSGQVYVADGAGSGVWTNQNKDHLMLNEYYLQDQMADISTPNDKVYFGVPRKSEIIRLTAILHGPITTSDDILSIYINGVLFADSLTVTHTSSAAGQDYVIAPSTANTVSAGDVIEVRTNGASDTASKATIQLGLRGKV